jgi:hypothetical protein
MQKKIKLKSQKHPRQSNILLFSFKKNEGISLFRKKILKIPLFPTQNDNNK